MFGSIYIGLSGLGAYSKGLQQVSNNVTNLNSQGFKASTVSFRDQFGVSGNAGGSTSNNRIGGHGVENGITQIDLKQGELRQTDRDLDLAVDGPGFLMLMRGGEIAYTRTGSFEIDKDGFITLAGSEYRLATLDAGLHPVSRSIDTARTSAPKATTTVKLADNLSSETNSYALGDISVVDANGTAHLWKLTFAKDASVPGQWTVTITDDKSKTIGVRTLKFVGGVIDPATSQLAFTDSDTGLAVTADLSAVTSFSAGAISTLRAASVDGHKLGTITSVTVNENGELEIGYSNEQKFQIGSVALADFRDPQALEQRSGGLFRDPGTAQREVLTSADPRAGKVISRRLEASNVDLSREFGDLILIQRGFQASSQIISVTNDMIQQLFGIRGQG